MKLKVKKKETTFDILNKKIDSLIEIIIPMIILLIPILFVLYVLNIHGYIFPKVNGEPIFSLHKYYFYLMIVLSLIPVTGVTLPFFSYGGSSLLVSMISIGIILSISKE